MTPRTHALDVPLLPGRTHRVALYEWGDTRNSRVAFCVHGLTRNGRDFDFLAEALSAKYRVIAIDIAGRGMSEWLENPKDYNAVSYLADIEYCLGALGVGAVDWIGTSMGGILGMLAAQQHPARVRRLVLNDVGAFIPAAGLGRLGGYVGKRCEFPTQAEAEAFMRTAYASFGIRDEPIWRHLFAHSIQPTRDGRVRLAYDPAIAASMTLDPPQDVDLRPVWKQVSCQVLIVRGEVSDILPEAVARDMCASRTHCDLVTIPNVGHAPTLMVPEEITQVVNWLGSD